MCVCACMYLCVHVCAWVCLRIPFTYECIHRSFTYLYVIFIEMIRFPIVLTHDLFFSSLFQSHSTHVWYDSFTYDVTHAYMWCDIFICEWNDSFVWDLANSNVTWLLCDMAHSYVTGLMYMWHGSFTNDMCHILPNTQCTFLKKKKGTSLSHKKTHLIYMKMTYTCVRDKSHSSNNDTYVCI